MKNVIITILLLALLGLVGFIVYDKIITKETSNNKGNNTNQNEKISCNCEETINDIYSYENKEIIDNIEVTNTIELKLNSDKTFILYKSGTGEAAYKGNYTLYNEKLKLYTTEIYTKQDGDGQYLNSDIFEGFYNKKDNTITLLKQHWNSQDAKKVDYKINEMNNKLTKATELNHIGKDYYQN